jgi:23S rRNA (guanosine2251-2'-O)-methyltransferase
MQVEGRNPVAETLKSDRDVSVVYIQHNITKDEKIREIISLAQKRGIRIRKTGKNKLLKMSHTKNHQGVIASVKYDFKSLNEIIGEIWQSKKQPFFVIINEVLYQQNLGAIIRTAECAGSTGVIIPKNTKITPEAIRASMGATEHIPVIMENLFNAIKILKRDGIRIIGLDAEGKRSIFQENLKGPIAIIVGGVHSGIGKSFIAKCDDVLKIPLSGKINSLNMSNAAAVALFEKVRQENDRSL